MPRIRPLLLLALGLALAAPRARAEDALSTPTGATPAQFGPGAGPTPAPHDPAGWRLLDEADTPRQSNAVAFEAPHDRPAARARFRADLRVLAGGDGGAIAFLATAEYGRRGPAPFCPSWVEPNLRGSFAVGIDVHNPPDEEMFSAWGNYQDLPQREVSLHFDGRELVKRVAPVEFRGDFAEVAIDLVFVTGGAEVTVRIAGAAVYERHFLPHVMPYPMRLALGAGTRADATTRFDVQGLGFAVEPLATRPRPPLHVDVFHRVLTDNKTTFYRADVDLPPASWAFGRIILTLDIHDAGKAWDEWDRNGVVSVLDEDGTPMAIVPFITSYRTECHWKVDVTHFRPWLTGKRTLEVRAGTTFYKNRGYMMSVSLDYHHGTPEHVASTIVPLWRGTAHYRSAENHFQDFFEPRTVTIPEGTTRARIWTTTTGHSQVGEFTPSKRTIVVDAETAAEGEGLRFANTLWKADVYLNPNRPQFGTWKFSRAGWAPGDIVHPWWIDLGDQLWPGATVGIRYEPEPYAFEGTEKAPPREQIDQASHVVRSYLILDRAADDLVPAPVLLVTDVAKGSNAAEAGIRRGDYLASYAGTRLDSVEDLRKALGAHADVEGRLPAVVYRGAKRLEVEVRPGRLGIRLGQR